MKIAMVSEHASPLAALGGQDAGGQNVHVSALATALAKDGHEITVYTRRDGPDPPDRVETAPGIAVEHVPAGPARPIAKDLLLPHMPAFARHLVRRLADDRPDVVHAHFWMSGLAALAAARTIGVPVVQTFHALGVVKRRHQGAEDTSPPGRIRLEQTLAQDVDMVIATSRQEIMELLRFGVPRDRVALVPCGVDTGRFRPDGPAHVRNGVPRLLYVGRLVRRKGVEHLIRAAARVPGTELVIAGGPPPAEFASDPEVHRLRVIAKEEHVADRTVFLGQVPHAEIPALMRSADLVLSTPRYEPFGMVPVEAMACGVPPVTSPVGGHLDSVADGVTGVHAWPVTPDRIAYEARALLSHPTRRRALGQAAAERARETYSWGRIAERTVAAYREVAG